MSNLTENVAKNVANEKVQDYVKKSHITTENEPKSEKTAQDVQKNCSSLTEKWKNGKLPNGRYYIETIPCEPCNVLGIPKYTDYYCIDSKFSYNITVKEVLAPVPSYEEWKSVCDDCNSMQETIFSQDSIYCENENLLEEIEKIDEENTKLKELLKECITIISENILGEYVIELCERITNEIGEK